MRAPIDLVACPVYHCRLTLAACVHRFILRRDHVTTSGASQVTTTRKTRAIRLEGCRGCAVGEQRATISPEAPMETE